MIALFTEFTLLLRIAHSEWALSQIYPLHEDVPGIMCELSHLRDRLNDLKGQQ